jgi:hypothetical protein
VVKSLVARRPALRRALALAAGSAWATLALNVDRLGDDAVVILRQFDEGAYEVPPLALGLFVGAASFVILRTRVMWRRLGFLGISPERPEPHLT